MAKGMDLKCITQSVAFMASALILVHVQIMAGEEIENVFGARFGLSTLAAAGLGNLISDVIGIGTAEPVQVRQPSLALCSATWGRCRRLPSIR